jgi:hypothetical protein
LILDLFVHVYLLFSFIKLLTPKNKRYKRT